MEYVICPSMQITQKHTWGKCQNTFFNFFTKKLKKLKNVFLMFSWCTLQIELQQEYWLAHWLNDMFDHVALAKMSLPFVEKHLLFLWILIEHPILLPKLQDISANQYKHPETARACKSVSWVGKVGLSLLCKGCHAYWRCLKTLTSEFEVEGVIRLLTKERP